VRAPAWEDTGWRADAETWITVAVEAADWHVEGELQARVRPWSWAGVLRAYAELERASRPLTDELLSAGVPDVRSTFTTATCSSYRRDAGTSATR
jgi:hypothetical protein